VPLHSMSTKIPAAMLQKVLAGDLEASKGWTVNGTPGFGDYFVLTAPEGQAFVVYVVKRDDSLKQG
jgi:hypothetical protein